MLDVRFSKKAKKELDKKFSDFDKGFIRNLLNKLKSEKFVVSKKVVKVKKCKKATVFRFEAGDYRILFTRNLKEKVVIVYSIRKRDKNTYSSFNCPEE